MQGGAATTFTCTCGLRQCILGCGRASGAMDSVILGYLTLICKPRARLGRHVLDRADRRDGQLLHLAHGQPKVAHAHRAVRRQEDILQLHVPARRW